MSDYGGKSGEYRGLLPVGTTVTHRYSWKPRATRSYELIPYQPAMECDRCGSEAVMHAAYSGQHLCGKHFSQSVERRVQKRIREDSLLGRDATPEDPETWVIGLSGGKDSTVLTTILHDTFAEDPRVELVCLTIHEGIEGYRDESLDACQELTADLGINHELVSYAEEFDLRMDEVVADDPENMAACAYCGVFRRDILERYAEQLDADKLLTGHNLDDEAETALMNILEGDVNQIAQHFDASLGSFDERADQDRFVPRAKPLRDIPEREVALYAHVNNIPAHMEECPHASESFRAEVQELLHQLEDRHPGTRHSILAGYEKLAGLATEEYGTTETKSADSTCVECGAPTDRERCRSCTLIEAAGGTR